MKGTIQMISHPSRTAARFVAVAGVLTCAVACTSSGSGNGTGAAPPGGATPATSHASTGATPGASGACHPDVTPQICVTVRITGTKTAAGTGQTTAPAPPEADPSWTCARLAANTAGDDRDLGDTVPSVGGHAVQWDAPIGDKPGTGTYPLSRTGTYVDVDGVGFDAEHGTANLTLRPDYSASFTFANLSSDAGTISGSISWTCLDPQ